MIYNVIHRILLEENRATIHAQKSHKRKWVRYERTYSNSMRYTDWKFFNSGKWRIMYMDNVLRFITRYGVFTHAAT